jgi:hypothetical protein
MRRFPDAALLASRPKLRHLRETLAWLGPNYGGPGIGFDLLSSGSRRRSGARSNQVPAHLGLCVQFIVGSRRHSGRLLTGSRAPRPLFSVQFSEKSRCHSLPPSSEIQEFEHREPDRGPNGGIKDDAGGRGERPHHGLIDADHRQSGQDHEHIGPPEAFRGSNRQALPPL